MSTAPRSSNDPLACSADESRGKLIGHRTGFQIVAGTRDHAHDAGSPRRLDPVKDELASFKFGDAI
ncbi:hypothetical protein [Mesorhizobium sp. A556]